MIVCPPMYVKRDGVQYRVDGIQMNKIYLRSQHQKDFTVDVSLGNLVQQDYHPITLAQWTDSPYSVIGGVLGIEPNEVPTFRPDEVNLKECQMAGIYEINLHKLSKINLPSAVLGSLYLPIVEAVLTRVPAKELFQGIKTLFGYEIPKVQVNYLSSGYMMNVPFERLLYRVMERCGDIIIDEEGDVLISSKIDIQAEKRRRGIATR